MCKHLGFILANQLFLNSEPLLFASAHPQQRDCLISLDAAEYTVLNNCLEHSENTKTALIVCISVDARLSAQVTVHVILFSRHVEAPKALY